MTNLIDNAIKYTHSQDSTTVTFGFDNNCLCLTVCDSGIGIAADQTESIFCRFQCCDRSRSEEGCGLGLSYCRAVFQQAGGDIAVQSAAGKGSIFC